MSVLDVDAVRAVTRLIDKGFEAYLVGGCVRDLLLDRTPKDYDIATAARPPQVKRTFPRNCRIIGRRFKLAHLHFHGNTKILECSTFRRTPQERPEGEGEDADLLITRDNEFGTAEEDALRRDFTVNALFLDPTRDLIVDHCNGLEDIEARVIRTIGDPVVRFREDPVRILRAAKFAGRLGFTVEKDTLAAMGETAEDLVRAAPPRVLEEILRLLRSGHAKPSFELLRDVGAIEHLIPVVGNFLKKADDDQHDAFWNLLGALDAYVTSRPGSEPPPNGVLLAVMMYGAVDAERGTQPSRSASSIAESLLGSLAIDLRLPRRDSGCLKRICGVQHRFEQPEDKRRFRVESFVHSPYFDEALQLFALRTAAAGNDEAVVEQWYELAGRRPDDEVETVEEAERAPRKKRRRRRRRRGDDEEQATDTAAAREDAPKDADAEAAATAADDDVATEDDEKPSRKKRASSKKPIRKKVAKKKAAAPDDEGDDSPADDRAQDAAAEAATDDSTDEEAAETASKAKAKKRKRTTRKKKPADDEDLSDVTFPVSDEPSPHGDPVKNAAGSKTAVDEDDDSDTFPHDRGNPVAHDDSQADDESFGTGFDEEQDEPQGQADDRDEDDDEEARRPRSRRSRRSRRGRPRDDDDEERDVDGEASSDDADASDADDADDREDDEREDTRPRKRRRRGRRGRGRSAETREDEEQTAEARTGNGDSGDADEAEDTGSPSEEGEARPRKSRSRSRGKKASEKRDGQKRDSKKRDGKKEKRGAKRDSKRDGKRGKRGRAPGSRDVDVVPRYRDRRGKVEVIEPPSLDLSAFDVELDPKRVPTFGSIVEGKGRPKKRNPRVMDGETDGYRPPPPPGGDDKPDAPPPPPPAEGPDTFGDW